MKTSFRLSTRTLFVTGWLTLAAVAALGAPASKVLRGHVPAAAQGRPALGPLATSDHLALAVGLPSRDRAGLETFVKRLYEPMDPLYHQYLTPAEFAARFGATPQQYQAVRDYFEKQGLKVTATYTNRLVLDVEGRVADINRALNITLRRYAHPTEAREFFAPDTEPSVPATLPVLDICGLDNSVLPHPTLVKAEDAQGIRSYATGSGPGGDFIGHDFRAAYAPGVTLTGQGQVIGLFQFGPYFSNNIPVYEQYAGLPSNIVVTNVLLDGVSGVPAPGADDGEEALDIEMAMSMAPGAVIVVYEGNSAYDILNRMATDGFCKQISCSWGFLPAPSGMDTIFLEFAAQGQTMFVASGDGGAYNASQSIFAPGDDPYITSVGGTSLTTSGAGGPWQSETTWGGSGGGLSATYGIPSYQQGLNFSANHGSTSQRNFPDVSMLADVVIFWVYKNGQTGTVGGTSAAAPLWGGFMALVNQQAVANGRNTIGTFNSSVYSLGKGATYTSVFHDITTGNNFNAGSPTNYPAVPGYDLCTGWGTPNGINFINALAGPNDPLQISPGIGFAAITPYSVPFSPTNVNFVLTNRGAASLNWTLANTSVWLNASSTSGTLPASSPAATVNVSLNTAVASALPVGAYFATVWITNLTSGVAQSRLFSITVSAANWPLALSGYNAGVIVAANATVASPGATGFDIANNYCFYQAGLNANPQVGGSGGLQGLPASGQFTSRADGQTVFQLGPPGSLNALMMGQTYPSSGTLTLANSQSYNSLAVLASSANGGGLGTLVVHFADGSSSPAFSYNDQDWYYTTANVALQGFGRLHLGQPTLYTEDAGSSNPNLYQTVINLAALGLNQPVVSVRFNNPAVGGNQDSGIFALSGAVMPPQASISGQPQSVTNTVPTQGASFTVYAMGTAPLSYQWYYSSSGSPGSFAVLTGQTSATLSLPPVLQPTNAGSFYAVVSNSLNAATSAVATLTVYRAPVITQQPTPASLFLLSGQAMNLSVAANAALPISYYWSDNGQPVGVNSASLTLNNLQVGNSGNYSVIVSNAYGTATSSVVALSVAAPPSYPYGQVVLADHPIGYWRLDEASGTVAHDYLAGRNGIYNRTVLGQPGYGYVSTHTVAKFGVLASVNSCATNIPIDFATTGNAGFSVEAWVNGGAQSTDAGLVTKGSGGGGEQFNLDCGAANHAFRFFVRDAGGGAHLANGTVTPNSRWHHLVGVCNESAGSVVLYVDGVSNASGTITAGSGLLSAATPMSIGARQSGTAQYDDQFVGSMEEVAIYNVALSAAQVRAHFGSATNRPPVFLANPFTELPAMAGQAYFANMATNFTDSDGDTLSFSKLSGPGWLLVAGNGALAGTPLSPDVGTNSFSVRALDAGGLATTANMIIPVTPAPPILAGVSLQTNNLVLTWTGGIPPYQVQMTTNLVPAIWQPVASGISGNTLLLAPSNSSGFLRVGGQ
jgi:hypothetical protein